MTPKWMEAGLSHPLCWMLICTKKLRFSKTILKGVWGLLEHANEERVRKRTYHSLEQSRPKEEKSKTVALKTSWKAARFVSPHLITLRYWLKKPSGKQSVSTTRALKVVHHLFTGKVTWVVEWDLAKSVHIICASSVLLSACGYPPWNWSFPLETGLSQIHWLPHSLPGRIFCYIYG